jgi:hypothetical protein
MRSDTLIQIAIPISRNWPTHQPGIETVVRSIRGPTARCRPFFPAGSRHLENTHRICSHCYKPPIAINSLPLNLSQSNVLRISLAIGCSQIRGRNGSISPIRWEPSSYTISFRQMCRWKRLMSRAPGSGWIISTVQTASSFRGSSGTVGISAETSSSSTFSIA